MDGLPNRCSSAIPARTSVLAPANIRAHIRIVLPHQLMMAAETVIGECEAECYAERDVA